jgi:HlyD family secretion protein
MEWLRSFVAAIMALFGAQTTDIPVFYGYAEGEYARLATRESGTLRELRVGRGDAVTAGAVVAVLDADSETAVRDEAAARVSEAEAQLADRRKGKRTPEIDALLALRRQAEAAANLSATQLRRYGSLSVGQVVSQEKLDETRHNYDRDRARVAELTAQIEVARLTARDDEIAAAEAVVNSTRATLRQAEWKLAQRTLTAPVSLPEGALVTDTYFVAGEHVGAGAPVVSLLPPGNIKLRFFVPEPTLPRLRIGQEIAIACDGCPAGLRARVTFIAPEAEYTPPVIYSRETRSKLVYLVEALPVRNGNGTLLHPGQPVEVRLTP